MILYGISWVDWSACERMNSRIERSSRIDRSIAYFCFMSLLLFFVQARCKNGIEQDAPTILHNRANRE